MKTPSAVFFDLDGTLIDSIGLIVDCFQHVTRTHLGYEISREAILRKIGRPLLYELKDLSPDNWESLLLTYREMQFARHHECVKPFPGAPLLLTTLRDKKIQTGIVTSKARRGTSEALKLFKDAASHIKICITVEDCENHKPDAEPLLLAALKAGVPAAECCYIGDTVFDMQAANAAKMTPIGVTWGVAARKDLEIYTNYIFDDFATLQRFILNAKN